MTSGWGLAGVELVEFFVAGGDFGVDVLADAGGVVVDFDGDLLEAGGDAGDGATASVAIRLVSPRDLIRKHHCKKRFCATCSDYGQRYRRRRGDWVREAPERRNVLLSLR